MIKAVSSCIGGAFQRVFCTFFQHFFLLTFYIFSSLLLQEEDGMKGRKKKKPPSDEGFYSLWACRINDDRPPEYG